MRQNAVISIIVPVYNVEKYLKRCIDSILNQTFKDFELILVNDGSTDDSGKICDDYKEKDNRIKVIHKKNGGLSSARNAGIDVAQGGYYGFVDSDDYISYDMYECLYKLIYCNDADIAICSIYHCYSNGQGRIKKNKSYSETNPKTYTFDKQEALKIVLQGKIFSMNVINRLYKRDLFKNIRFPEEIKFAEDVPFSFNIFKNVKKVVFYSSPKYFYMHRSLSLTTSNFNTDTKDVIKSYKSILKITKEKFPNLIVYSEFRYLWSYISIFDKMILSEKIEYPEEYSDVLSNIKKSMWKILKNPNFSLKRKLLLVVLIFNESLYKKGVRRYHEKYLKVIGEN
ncbi:MAG: glycosyltransferase [Methanobrevibacter sp.]|nr:glycosyltransferase [Candidatus Methanovirga aequatorialis]